MSGSSTLLALQMLVALVDGMDGDGDIAEHGLRARGGDEEFIRCR